MDFSNTNNQMRAQLRSALLGGQGGERDSWPCRMFVIIPVICWPRKQQRDNSSGILVGNRRHRTIRPCACGAPRRWRAPGVARARLSQIITCHSRRNMPLAAASAPFRGCWRNPWRGEIVTHRVDSGGLTCCKVNARDGARFYLRERRRRLQSFASWSAVPFFTPLTLLPGVHTWTLVARTNHQRVSGVLFFFFHLGSEGLS